MIEREGVPEQVRSDLEFFVEDVERAGKPPAAMRTDYLLAVLILLVDDLRQEFRASQK